MTTLLSTPCAFRPGGGAYSIAGEHYRTGRRATLEPSILLHPQFSQNGYLGQFYERETAGVGSEGDGCGCAGP